MVWQKHHGLTLTELKIALVILGLLALFAIPKIKTIRDDKQANALIRESYATIGSAYLTRLQDPDYPALAGAEDIGGANAGYTFAQYLYAHLNYTGAINPATVTAAQYCSTDDNYFVLPLGVTVREICSDASTNPPSLRVKLQIPINGGASTTQYQMVMPQGQERFTTLFGFNTTNSGIPDPASCTYADTVLKMTSVCPTS
jgi:prepilin-type N-terminal cleavage/methylation domain-containing protein